MEEIMQTDEIDVLIGDTCHRASVVDGVITGISPSGGPHLSGGLWTTGFADLHCHGAMGHGFDTADAGDIAEALQYHRSQGTSSVVLSLVSAPVPQLVARLHGLRGIVPTTPGADGVHLEGPFLAPGRRGAHDPAALIMPSAKVVAALVEAGDGILRQVTIAPELPGALEAIDVFVSEGVRVAIGHTEADYDITAAALDRGASILTHAFNAMPGLGHRQPGPVGAALDRDHVVIEVVADGHHVHPTVLRALFAAAPARVALVTDAMSAAGLGDGSYELGGLAVDVVEGRPLLRGSQTLAGSTLTMRRAVEVAVAAGIDPLHAARAATSVPRSALGRVAPAIEVGTRLDALNRVDPWLRGPE